MRTTFNSTIAIREKTCVDCGLPKQIFSKGRCKQCASKTYKPIAKMSSKRERELQGETFIDIMDELDIVFSRYIRIRDSDNKGLVSCFTCGYRQSWKQSQCGHFISRSHLMTRWLPENGKNQCVECNCIKNGNLEVYEQNLEAEKKGVVEFLKEQGHLVWKPTREDLKELLVTLRHKLQIVQLKLTA